MTTPYIGTYEEAKELVNRYGILPLAPSVPSHPSISASTAPEAWHTGQPSDPWSWRVRFPSEGDAAYGKFFRGKSILVSADLFPLLKRVAGRGGSVKERYRDGLLPREAVDLYEVIAAGGIDTRELRQAAGMKAKTRKADYDRGIRALQEAMDIVVTGAHTRLNADGEPSGWSSVAYSTAEAWMKEHDIDEENVSADRAAKLVKERLEETASSEAMRYLAKIYPLR
ncbi:hypothetical protein [Gorillibacterium sp. CAU 1737]|uniref:AlkZ-related protein n=1 Tax=Gorillibacterium sp. CAU 1737 TaxID=3140362 RepID=UPI0032619A7E